jgi:hypothetical protein
LLAIPCFLIVLALVGMALSTESREDFEERAEQSGSGDQSDQSGNGQDQANGDQQQGDGSQSQSQQGQSQGQDSESGSQNEGQSGSQGNSGNQGGEGQRPVIIQTENGEIVIELDENGQPVRVSPGDSFIPADPGRTLTPDPDGNLIGFRVSDDGLLEPVERDDVQAGDFLLEPADGGVRITEPSGDQINLSPSDDGELTGREFTTTGTENPLVPDEDGDITIQSADDLAPGIEVDPNTQPLVITSDEGPIRIELEPTGDIVADQPTGQPIEVDPDDLSAIRVNEDGQLELVPLDEVQPDDTLLVPTDDGFDLVRPDGSRVEFRPDGENDGVTATEIGPDGQETELTPNPDGSVTLSDGTTVGPIDIAEDGGTFEQIVDRASSLPWPWVFGGIALLALLSIGTAVYLHRNRPDDPFDYSQFATTGVPEDQFEKFLAVLIADPDPARAVRLAFYATERGLGGVPPRRADETPFEWHARVEQRRPELAVPLAPICDMFARARFAPGDASGADRDLMVEHLRELNAVANHSTEKFAGV